VLNLHPYESCDTTPIPPAKPGPRDRLALYRWYSKEHAGILRSLEEGGSRMADSGCSAIARVVAMEFFGCAEAPTLAEFARARFSQAGR